ncbi:MAG: ABC transporter ATP-binding protein [Lachnospiraceae bacterium]|nr:ABC transporter ATP-binding protein [Lachnospiraceae bacterium]
MPGPGSRPPRGVKPTAEHPMQTLGRVLSYVLKRYRIHCILVFIMIITSVLCNVQGTLFIQTLIDDYIKPMIGQSKPDFLPLLKAMARVAVFYLLGAASSYGHQKLMIYVTQGTLRDLRNDLFTHMETLPISYFDTHAHGDIMSVYTNDIDALRQMVSQSIPQFINSAFTIVSVFISMLVLDIPLTLVTLLMVFVMMGFTAFLSKNSGKHFMAQQKDLGKLNGFIEETMTGQKVVKVFNHEEAAKADFKVLNDTLFNSAYNANRFANYMGPINAQLGNLSYVICTFVGAILVLNHLTGLTLGGLASFLTFNKSFNMPINQISMQMNSIIMAMAGADRIFKLMDEKPEEDEGYVTLVNAKYDADGNLTETPEHTGMWAWRHEHQADHSVDYKPQQGDLYMENVDFGYVPEKQVLYDVSLYAKPGQKIAFVGSTGAGKTTITNLINRFYDIQDGKIRYDGININKIKKADLRRSLGIVLQETNLFTGTVRDNIRFGKLNATAEEIEAAAKLANADTFISQLPNGYDTYIGERGVKLSGGQKQRLSIARVFLKDPPILVLDEATSALDNESERYIQESLRELAKGRTTFTIAHRLTTIRSADVIWVLTQNGIEEAGDHETLMKKNGLYAGLYKLYS